MREALEMRGLYFAVGVVAIIAFALIVVACAEKTKGDSMGKHIEITIGSARFQAVLEENGTAAAFLRELPLTVEMRELNGNEKYADLATPLPTSAETPGTIRCGDLMLYGSSTVVLFYENFSSPYRYTVLGRVENPDGLQVALGRGNPTVTFAAVPEEEKKRLASDGAVIQRENPSMPTRVLKSGTRIRMHFGDTVIPGILNDGETARALIARLPVTVRMSRYSHDFCGVLAEPLPCRESEVHYGWLNGDIDFARDGSYFTILFADEETSEQYGHQINIGVVTCELSRLAGLRGSYEVRIELAE